VYLAQYMHAVVVHETGLAYNFLSEEVITIINKATKSHFVVKVSIMLTAVKTERVVVHKQDEYQPHSLQTGEP